MHRRRSKQSTWQGLLAAGTWLLTTTLAQAQPVKLLFWHFFGSNVDGLAMEQLINEFNAAHQNEVQIETSFVPSEYYQKLDVALAAGTAPDLAIVHARYLGKYAVTGMLQDVNGLVRRLGGTIRADRYVPVAWQAGTLGAAQLGVPLDIIVSQLLYYNIDLFEQAGLDPKAPPQDADSYRAHGRKLKGLAPDIWPIWLEGGYGLYRNFFTLLYQGGGSLLTRDNKAAAFNTQAGLAAASFLRELVETGLAPWPPINVEQGFTSNKIGFFIHGGWQISAFDRYKNLRYGVAQVPKFFNDRSFFANSHMFVLPKQTQENTAKLSAALKFMDWWGQHSIVWAQAGHLPARWEVVRSPEFRRLPRHQAHLSQAEFARYSPAVPRIDEVERLVQAAVIDVVSGRAAPPAALSDAASRVDAVLRQ